MKGKTNFSNSDYKRKLEYQRYLAQDHPARIYDLTDCNITEIPKDIFSFCKVIRKYSLNLSRNKITSLESGGRLEDLNILGSLNLSFNLIKSLPNDICKLTYLQALFLGNNKISKFPSILIDLPNLRILHLQRNEIKTIPDKVKEFKSLEEFDLSYNPLTTISKYLCEIKTLKKLNLNLEKLKNIDRNIIESGVKEFWKHLCLESGRDPFEISITISSPPESLEVSELNKSKIMKEYNRISQIYDSLITKHDQYLSEGDRNEHYRYISNVKKMTEDEEKMINETLSNKYKEDSLLINKLAFEDMHPIDLIEKIKEITLHSLKVDKLKRKCIKQLTIEDLKKEPEMKWSEKIEIIDSMKSIISNISKLAKDQADLYYASEFIDLNLFRDYFVSYRLDSDESLQRSVLRALLSQEDSQMIRLKDVLNLVEKKLVHLSRIERVEDIEENDQISSRHQLVTLLQKLRNDITNLNSLLDEEVRQIENSREILNDKTFWIRQFRHYKNSKNKASNELKELLNQIKMPELLPLFEKYDCTVDIVIQMNNDDLIDVGIDSNETRIDFLNRISNWKFEPIKSRESEVIQEPSAPSMFLSEMEQASAPPSIMELPSIKQPQLATSPLFVKARKETECCICMNEEARMLFLNCGHVCCCCNCAHSMDICPLCREQIVQLVSLDFN